MKLKECFLIYFLGSVAYQWIEILWRGYTHWTMGIVGGVCLVIIYRANCRFENLYLPIKAGLSALVITTVELLSGVVINKIFHMHVWDYSNLPFNLWGQISLVYSVLWFFLCIPAIILCKIIRHCIFRALPEKTSARIF